MSKYNFDLLAKRKNTNCVKYDEFDSSLPMWVADMDFLMPPKIKEAIQKDLDIGAIGYSLIPDAFFDAFVNLYHHRYQTSFTRDDMIYVSGVVASIDSMIKLLTKVDDNIVMLSPIYHTFYHCISNYNRHALVSKMIDNGGTYSINWSDLEDKLANPKSSLMILCNPHNPVGKIFSKEELEKIDELATKHGVLVISDEIHGLVTNPDKKYIPYINVAKGRFVICTATSKAFNLAGLQSAVVICKDKELKEQLQKAFYADDIGEPNFFAVNANIAALRDSEDWLDEMNEYVYLNKIKFSEYLFYRLPEVKVHLTEATYMVWVDVSKYTSDSRDFCEKLNEKTGLLVSPGIQFGDGGEGFLRINLATSLENVMDAAKRLETFIKSLQQCAYLKENQK